MARTTRNKSRRTPGSMLAHGAWIAFCAFGAWVAYGVEIDRQARTRAGYEALTPKPFRFFVQGREVEKLLTAERGQAALVEAKKLLWRSPLPAESLSALGRAALMSGDQRTAQAALTAAANRGWRDGFTQIIMARTGVQIGDPDLAALRLMAFMSTAPKESGLDAPVVREILADEPVREAFGKQLVQMPLLPGRFMQLGNGIVGPDAYADVLIAFRKAGGKVDCSPVEREVTGLLEGGQYLAAEKLWAGVCGQTPRPSTVASLAFNSEPVNGMGEGPFGWVYPASGGLSVELDDDRLSYRNSTSVEQSVAHRYVRMTAGQHKVTRAAAEGNGGTVFKLRCVAGAAAGQQLADVDLDIRPAEFLVPAGCAAQRLDIIAPTSSDIRDMVLRMDQG